MNGGATIKQWEYQTTLLPEGIDAGKRLDHYGQDGWELVAVVAHPRTDNSGRVVQTAYLKRLKGLLMP